MINKTIFTLLLLLLYSYTIHAQKVGINTNDPQTTLDIAGDVRARKEIRLGQTEGIKGDAGTIGEVLTSRGPGLSPEWKKPEESRTTYKLKESVVLIDEVGVIFTESDHLDITEELKEDSELEDNSQWKEITGLSSSITPTKAKNRILFTIQTIAQAYPNIEIDYLYAIGIFVDGKLKCTRPLSLIGNAKSFEQGILYSSLVNLPVKAGNASYKIEIAVMQRYRNANSTDPKDWLNFVGTSTGDPYYLTGPSNTNKWMNKTSMKVELYEALLD